MTPKQIEELRLCEQHAVECDQEVTTLLADEATTVGELKDAVYLARLVWATVDALRRPSSCMVEVPADNVIPFPVHRTVH